jgi:hypothetical protein
MARFPGAHSSQLNSSSPARQGGESQRRIFMRLLTWIPPPLSAQTFAPIAVKSSERITQVAATISSDGIWQLLLSDLPRYARGRVEALFESGEIPPFFPFVVEAIEKDAAIGRPGPLSAPFMDTGLVLRAISNAEILALPDAVRLARAAAKLDDRLDDKLLNRLTGPPRQWPYDVPESETAHVLEVVGEISDCRRLVMPLMKFLKLPQKQLRSKAVKLIARASQNPGWAEILLTDDDPRVRANLIDGIALQDGPQIDILLRRASADSHHRVAVTALLGLCQRGDQSSCERIRRLALEGDDAHRVAAEWALRQLANASAAPVQAAPVM